MVSHISDRQIPTTQLGGIETTDFDVEVQGAEYSSIPELQKASLLHWRCHCVVSSCCTASPYESNRQEKVMGLTKHPQGWRHGTGIFHLAVER